VNPLQTLAVVLMAVASVLAAEPVQFGRDIAPLLQDHCLACHRAEKARGRYRLDTFDQLRRSGESGRDPLVPGNPSASSLHELLIHADPDQRMPQDSEPLGPQEVSRIRRWIEEGAGFDGPDSSVPLSASIPRAEQPLSPEKYRRPVPVAAMAFSPDGSELVLGGMNELLVRRVPDGGLARRLGGFPERLQSLSWDKGGSRLAVAGGRPGRSGEAVLVDPKDGRLLAVLRTGSDLMTAVRFNPDGSRVAVGGTDGSVTVHEAGSGARVAVLPAHADWVLGLDWSADGRWLVSVSRDRTVRVADAVSGDPVASFTEHGAPVFAAVFFPDGKQVLSVGRDHQLRVWSAENSEARSRSSTDGADLLAFLSTADGVLSAGSDGVVRHHPWASVSKPVVHPAGGRLLSLAFDVGQKRIAAGSFDGVIRIWTLGAPEPFSEFPAFP
jgi:WD40 repeat protein